MTPNFHHGTDQQWIWDHLPDTDPMKRATHGKAQPGGETRPAEELNERNER